MPSVSDTKRAAAICELLDTIHIVDERKTWNEAIREVRVLLDCEQVWMFQVLQAASGWRMTRWSASGDPDGFGQAFATAIASSPLEWAWFNPSCPERAQRNRVVEALSASSTRRPGYFEASHVFAEAFYPYRLHRHRQLRVLVCDDDRLLGWFGAVQPRDATRRQHSLLQVLVPSLRRRMAADQRLESVARLDHTIDAVLDQIQCPALVLHAGAVAHANRAAAALLAHPRSELLVECERAKRQQVAGVELVRLDGDLTIAIFRRAGTLADVAARIAGIAQRWKLSKRTAEVLRHVVDGHANATIAEMLGISTRAVELHVTTLLDRAGVDGRTALVARVLG